MWPLWGPLQGQAGKDAHQEFLGVHGTEAPGRAFRCTCKVLGWGMGPDRGNSVAGYRHLQRLGEA